MGKQDQPPELLTIKMSADMVRKKTADLIPYVNNARTHSEEQVAQIAASIREFGFNNPILLDGENGIIAGHGRLLASMKLGLVEVPTIELSHLSESQKRAYVLADNKLAENAGWDSELLKIELDDLDDQGFDLSLIGFSADELSDIMGPDEDGSGSGGGGTDEVPEVPEEPITFPGDVWLLGKHRAMCGDSTIPEDVARLMDGKLAALIHADPPYGMGKEKDGVMNDNLYCEKLDAFQLKWWHAFRPWLTNNASAYIWGNSGDLWRLWYGAGLCDTEEMALRNEIVWDKKSIPGMGSDLLTQYPIASERCLFIQIGKQFLGNINTEDYPEEYEPIRGYLEEQAKAAGIGPKDIREHCGCQMFGHWFTRSQFTLIPAKHYATLQDAYPDHFQRPWSELKAIWDGIKGTGRGILNSRLAASRSYFDKGHSTMHDVWEFSRVQGDERYGHATPKPVPMMERVMVSSLPEAGLCVEPFGGSGSTVMGAEKTGRICYTMELDPRYVDVIVRRWEKFAGKKATLEGDGRTFEEVATERETF